MELDKCWCSSGSSHSFRWSKCRPNPSTGHYNRIISVNNTLVLCRSKLPWWTILWRKLKREKKKILNCSSTNRLHVSYDPYTYAKNFDQGLMSDPEDIARSFSARFAVPSRIFDNGGLTV
ncbi:hypothetical protein SLE2022_382790 [Rubroshorea leprosula]